VIQFMLGRDVPQEVDIIGVCELVSIDARSQRSHRQLNAPLADWEPARLTGASGGTDAAAVHGPRQPTEPITTNEERDKDVFKQSDPNDHGRTGGP
jgi:hypothetical protein